MSIVLKNHAGIMAPGELGGRPVERVKDHNGRDNKLHVLKHSTKKRHTEVDLNKIKIIAPNYNNNKWKRKVSAAVLLKHYRPRLNVQEQSISLKLLN